MSFPALPALASEWLDEFYFLGTGTSSQVPSVHCILDGSQAKNTCATCADALRPGSVNRRRCTSAVAVGAPPGRPEERSTILIDCGKSFYESIVDVFPKHGLRRIDAVLLTHAHADAILGLDDLRGWTMGGCIQDYVDVYLTAECMATVKSTFPYLVDASFITGGGDVGALRWHLIDAQKPFEAGPHRVPILPLPVEHGFVGPERRPFECLGFRIDSMSYVSDCHAIPALTMAKMAGSEVVVMDALKMTRHASHFSIPQAIQCILELASKLPAPPLALFVDLTHGVEHHTTEAKVQEVVHALRCFRSTLPPALEEHWWTPVWNADENEAQNAFVLHPTSGGTDDPCAEVPAMHLAIDGLRLVFTKA